jgi:endonuclease/exonuclease/phosphatase family metal-dependent hydrolase
MLVHLNTHFEDGPDGETSRAEGARLIAERLGRLQAGALPAVVTGDFNANPWSVPYRLFMGSGFSDSYRAAGHGDSVDSSSYHGFQGRGYFAPDWGEQLFWRVDWILARDGAAPVRSVSSSIVREAEPPLYPSDHYPVVSELLMEEE